jgi:microcystin-dependent protein
MAVASFKISQNLNIDEKIVDLQGTSTTNQVLAYSTSTNTFLPTLETPVGTVVMYGGSSVPTGWLLCDGTVYNISSYNTLGNLLLSRYGGNGTTTFAVPNFVSRLPVATTLASNPATSSVSASDTFNHSHTATYGTDGVNVDLAHNHTTAAPNADHNHTLNSDKGNHAHGTTGNGGIGHTHSLSYKMGQASQATSNDSADHTHGYSTDNANHSHLTAANSDVHSHGESALATTSHAHAHNSITLVTANQTTSISNHSHGSFNVMQMLFIIKT